MNKKLYVSQLFEDNKIIPILNNNSLKDTHSGLKNGNIDIESILNLIDNCCDNPSMTIEVNNIDEVEECILFLLNRYIIK